MKEAMIVYLKKWNEITIAAGRHEDVATVLFYEDGEQVKSVTDYSPFIDHMSEELRSALANGQTLTEKQQLELNTYRIERFN